MSSGGRSGDAGGSHHQGSQNNSQLNRSTSEIGGGHSSSHLPLGPPSR
jgi:hypothetical protein